MGFARIDHELPRWAAQGGNARTFFPAVAKAFFLVCAPDDVLLRLVLVELKLPCYWGIIQALRSIPRKNGKREQEVGASVPRTTVE